MQNPSEPILHVPLDFESYSGHPTGLGGHQQLNLYTYSIFYYIPRPCGIYAEQGKANGGYIMGQR